MSFFYSLSLIGVICNYYCTISFVVLVRYLSVSLSFTLSRNEKVEKHIGKKTHKPNVLRFWVGGGVISLCVWPCSHYCLSPRYFSPQIFSTCFGLITIIGAQQIGNLNIFPCLWTRWEPFRRSNGWVWPSLSESMSYIEKQVLNGEKTHSMILLSLLDEVFYDVAMKRTLLRCG